MEINLPKTMCGCPCGWVISLIITNQLQIFVHLFLSCQWVRSSTPQNRHNLQDWCSFPAASFLLWHSSVLTGTSVKATSSGQRSFVYQGPKPVTNQVPAQHQAYFFYQLFQCCISFASVVVIVSCLLVALVSNLCLIWRGDTRQVFTVII